jgi:eukaryotic-like serine/threonine-protein kinase
MESGNQRNTGEEPTAVDMSGGTTPPVPARQDPYLGRTIDGRYLVESLIGEGGMGYVYRARHKVIDKRVAIKILKTDAKREKELTDRFLQEAKSASSIGNPHIVDISDFGQLPDGATYFVMEYLDGASLGQRMEQHKGTPWAVPRIMHIGKQIALGLAAAHEAGIVHRDLKPDNVMIVPRGADKDFVKILDFGIAKVVGDESHKITRAGSVFGTPHYMSPEQAAGTPVDQRTDIYALGVILYELASGRVPFDADNFMGILTQHMYKAPVSILALVPPPGEVPPGLDAIVLKCLSKKPEGRYATMADLAADIELLERGQVPLAVPEMMSRSGGFNVPQDYFRNSRPGAMPEAVPATPAGVGRSRWPLFAVVGAVVGLGLVGVALAIATSKPSGARPKQDPTATLAATASVPTGPSAIPAVDPSATPDTSREILLSFDPADTKLMRGDTPIDGPPFAVTLKAGEHVDLVAKRAGYKDVPLALDDKSERRMLVKMQPLYAGVRPPKPAGGTAAGATTTTTAAPPPPKPPGPKPKCDITEKGCDPWK